MRFIERVVDAIIVQGGPENPAVFNNENGEVAIDLDAVEVQHQMVEAIIEIGEDRIDDVLRAIFNQIGERQI